MGTHPIFESDFDCLTDLTSTQNACQVAEEACPTTEAKAKKDATTLQVNGELMADFALERRIVSIGRLRRVSSELKVDHWPMTNSRIKSCQKKKKKKKKPCFITPLKKKKKKKKKK